MTDFPPPPPPDIPPPPPPGGFGSPPPPPPGYALYSPTGPATTSGAGFWIRFLGVFIDWLVIGVPFWILGQMVGDDTTTRIYSDGTMTESTTSVGFWVGWSPQVPLWLNLLSTAVGVCYFGYLEGGLTGQTLGKRVAGIRVVDAETGAPGIGFGRAVGRYFARILSAIPCLLGYFWMLWDGRKQTWHDKLVRTLVVKG